jgi:hypothetical protein
MGDTLRGVDFTLESGASIFGTINHAGSDTVGVSADSLGVFVVLYDASSGGFVDAQDGTFDHLNTVAGGFHFHSVMPGSYKLAAAGLWGGQAVTWYSTSGPVNDYASASTLTVTEGEGLELFHFINPVDQGATISGSVSMLGPGDPSEYSWVFAISQEGYPAGLGYTGDPRALFLDLEDLYYSYYGEVAAEEKSVGSYVIPGLPDGTYHLRSWSPDLLFTIFDEYYDVVERSPSEGSERYTVADYWEFPQAYLENLQDRWYDQIPAGPLTDFLEWETDFVSGLAPAGATPVTITGGISQSDIDFFLAVLAIGDPNGDGVFDIGDVISLVNAILRISPFGPNQISAADLNDDGVADIGDVVSMIISLLGGTSASGPGAAPSGEFLVSLGTPDIRTSGVEIPIWTRLRQPLTGLQLTFEISGDADVVAANLPAGITMASHRDGDELRVLLYSTQGSVLPAEETRLLRMLRPNATLQTAGEGVRFLGARGAAANGAAVTLQSFDIGEGPIGLGTRYTLEDNWPNPFNPTTTIAFTLPRTSTVRLRVYNIRGQVVKTLMDGELGGGRHTVQWDGTDAAGRKVATGIYLYTLEAGGFRASKKMLLVK